MWNINWCTTRTQGHKGAVHALCSRLTNSLFLSKCFLATRLKVERPFKVITVVIVEAAMWPTNQLHDETSTLISTLGLTEVSPKNLFMPFCSVSFGRRKTLSHFGNFHMNLAFLVHALCMESLSMQKLFEVFRRFCWIMHSDSHSKLEQFHLQGSLRTGKKRDVCCHVKTNVDWTTGTLHLQPMKWKAPLWSNPDSRSKWRLTWIYVAAACVVQSHAKKTFMWKISNQLQDKRPAAFHLLRGWEGESWSRFQFHPNIEVQFYERNCLPAQEKPRHFTPAQISARHLSLKLGPSVLRWARIFQSGVHVQRWQNVSWTLFLDEKERDWTIDWKQKLSIVAESLHNTACKKLEFAIHLPEQRMPFSFSSKTHSSKCSASQCLVRSKPRIWLFSVNWNLIFYTDTKAILCSKDLNEINASGVVFSLVIAAKLTLCHNLFICWQWPTTGATYGESWLRNSLH